MTLEELIALLEKAGNTDAVDFVKSLDASHKEKVNKVNSEAKGLRERAKTAEKAAETVKERLETVLTKLGVETELEDDAFTTAIEEATKGGKVNPDLEKRLNLMNEQNRKLKAEMEKGVSEERGKRLDVVKRAAIKDALTAGKAHDIDTLTDVFLSRVKVGDDEKLFLDSEDGSQVSVTDGIAAFLKTKPGWVTNQQLPGAGSHTGGNAGGTGNLSEAAKFAEGLAKGNGDSSKTSLEMQSEFFGGGK